ncbi:MAG TPA: agmatine deiminase [Cytophagales bacterium]|nr:agmatine deiminase [Cytophagales bacterium]HAA20392.1 agmatine deiminase [Cytophagales bacterium]HAP62133.1 agmatine deiminase [Cytophagales bacterium]
MIKLTIALLVATAAITSCQEDPQTMISLDSVDVLYTMPEESEPHEGTWLQWPHHYQYGMAYRNSLDATWVAMVRELVSSENVHIIAYNAAERNRIIGLLNEAGISLSNIDFKLYETDDTWIRDSGPIYARDAQGHLVVEDWGFNGWGNKVDELSGLRIESGKCDQVPSLVALDQGRALIDLNLEMVNKGGSVEIDGNGTLMACKSSILNRNRNPGMTQAQAEVIFKQYLGATNFIWLEGQAGLEITDQHIDGFARFGNATTIVTMNREDLLDYDVQSSDIDLLYAAQDKHGNAYTFLKVPLTQNDVSTTNGTNLGYKGSYINYYIANTKVLVPNYHDPNDAVANALIQTLYPGRTVVGIDVRNLYENGGMIHCVTQQQPAE